MIRVDILDSSPIFTRGLEQILTAEGIRVMGTRTSPAQEWAWFVDVLIVDLDALDESRAVGYVAEMAKVHEVVILADDVRATDTAALIRAGASGVLSKRGSPAALVDSIRAVAAGATVTCQPVPDEDAEERAPDQTGNCLSAREEQVLRQISRGLTHGQVARRLGISPHTVDTYVKRIRSKLGVGNKAELTRAAVLRGMTSPAAARSPDDRAG